MQKRESWKIKPAVLTACGMALVLSASIGESHAYFTTYAVAEGSLTILAETDTELREKFEGRAKTVWVENTGRSDCFVRIRAFSGSRIELVYDGDGWSKGAGDYWYYEEPLSAGEVTKPLTITIKTAEDAAWPEQFEVAVVEEYTPVSYRDGTLYGEWGPGESGAAGK